MSRAAFLKLAPSGACGVFERSVYQNGACGVLAKTVRTVFFSAWDAVGRAGGRGGCGGCGRQSATARRLRYIFLIFRTFFCIFCGWVIFGRFRAFSNVSERFSDVFWPDHDANDVSIPRLKYWAPPLPLRSNLSVKLNMSETFPGCRETCRKRRQTLAETSANVRKNIGKRSEKHRKTLFNVRALVS